MRFCCVASGVMQIWVQVWYYISKQSIRFNVCPQKRPKKREVVCSFSALPVHDLTLDQSTTWGHFSRSWYYPESLCQTLTNTLKCQNLHTISLCSKKMQPWSLATWERTSQRHELWWPLAFSGPNSTGHTIKIQVGRQLEQAKYGANAKAKFSFFRGHNFGLNAQSLKWIAWRERETFMWQSFPS